MNEKLNLDNAASISEAGFEAITDIIRNAQTMANIVEFGSGRSSIRLAMTFPESSILSIEGNRQFFDRTNALAEEFGLGTNLKVKYRPLKFQNYGPGQILSYDQTDLISSDSIDCVIIDGPPFYTLRGREACLYQSYTKLRLGGVVILDDYARKAEKAILKNWLHVYPESFSIEVLNVGNQLAVLQKRETVEANWDSPVKYDDNIAVNDSYDRIKFAMSHISDEDWDEWFESKGLADRSYHRLINQIREAYGISADQIQAALQADEKLAPVDRKRLQEENIEYCLELFEMTDQL